MYFWRNQESRFWKESKILWVLLRWNVDRHTTRERAARTFKGLPAKVNEKIYKMVLNIEYIWVSSVQMVLMLNVRIYKRYLSKPDQWAELCYSIDWNKSIMQHEYMLQYLTIENSLLTHEENCQCNDVYNTIWSWGYNSFEIMRSPVRASSMRLMKQWMRRCRWEVIHWMIERSAICR